MEHEIFTAISTIGFPAAVCLYTLIKIDSTLDRLTLAINAVSTKIDTITGIYDATGKEFDAQNRNQR